MGVPWWAAGGAVAGRRPVSDRLAGARDATDLQHGVRVADWRPAAVHHFQSQAKLRGRGVVRRRDGAGAPPPPSGGRGKPNHPASPPPQRGGVRANEQAGGTHSGGILKVPWGRVGPNCTFILHKALSFVLAFNCAFIVQITNYNFIVQLLTSRISKKL